MADDKVLSIVDVLGMQRRGFIALLGGAVAWPVGARAQRRGKMLRVGTVAGAQRSASMWVAFERRMAELGYQEGHTFSFDFVQARNVEKYEIGYRTLAARDLEARRRGRLQQATMLCGNKG